MYPELFSINSWTLHSYGLLLALGILLGYWVSRNVAKYRVIGGGISASKKFINYIFTGTVICAMIGARLAYVALSPGEYISAPYKILFFWEGGLVFFGGLAGGLVWVIYSASKWKVNLWKVADVLSVGLAVGLAIGRIGCFLAGCCYGKPTEIFIGVTFSHPAALCPTGIPLHPTQLYSSLFMFILAGVLYLKIKKSESHTHAGSVFALYLIGHGLFRVGIEFLRGDFRGGVVVGLTLTQWFAIIMVIVGMWMVFYRNKTKD